MKLSLDLLKPDPANARRISDRALVGLSVSAETFGDLSGITWNEQLGLLVAGHQRMRVLRAAGATEWVREAGNAFVIHPKTKERFRIRIVKWDETTHRMAELTANNQHIQGEYEDEMVAAQLAALEHDDRFSALGLADLEGEIGDALAALRDEQPAAGATDPDDIPEPPAVPVTKLGDLWILGDHRLLCGDSTKPEDVARLMGGGLAALGLHDPPYGISIVESGLGDGQRHGNAVAPRGKFRPIAGDQEPFDPAHLLGTAPVIVLWGANHYADRLPPRASWLVWDKRVDLPSNGFSDCELAWVSVGNSARIIRHMWNGMIRATEMGEPRVHPTQKPVALMAEIIGQHTQKGAVVHDGYGGSGSTLVACQTLGRRARVMELAPTYCDVIVARWEAFTGLKATLES